MLVQPAFATEATCRVFAGDVDRGAQTVRPPAEAPELVAQIAEPEVCRIVERLFLIEVVSFDWNCPQYITPRYTAEEAQSLVAPLKQRIAELEAQLRGGLLTSPRPAATASASPPAGPGQFELREACPSE
jgi:hypothetical protein